MKTLMLKKEWCLLSIKSEKEYFGIGDEKKFETGSNMLQQKSNSNILKSFSFLLYSCKKVWDSLEVINRNLIKIYIFLVNLHLQVYRVNIFNDLLIYNDIFLII